MDRTDYTAASESFGETIRQAREKRGWTPEDLAAHCDDITPMHIPQLERGERVPKLKTCRQLAKALNLDETALLDKAYREHIPEDMRTFLEGQSPEEISSALARVFEIADTLDPARKKNLAEAWYETLKLLGETG